MDIKQFFDNGSEQYTKTITLRNHLISNLDNCTPKNGWFSYLDVGKKLESETGTNRYNFWHIYLHYA